jgi:hypothetical protein
VNDGTNIGDVALRMGILEADTNGDGEVNSGDVSQTKSQVGQVLGAGNAREDINFDGGIDSGDVSVAKSRSGTALPPDPATPAPATNVATAAQPAVNKSKRPKAAAPQTVARAQDR